MTGEKKKTQKEIGASAPVPSGSRKKEGGKRYPEEEIIDALQQEGETGGKEMDELYGEVAGRSGASREKRSESKKGEDAKSGE